MIKQMRPALIMLTALTVLTGVLYPLAITGLAQLAFPHQARGSLIEAGGRVVGSELIGQWFEDPKYFWPRLSATSHKPYNAASSSGSNYGPLNPDLRKATAGRVEQLRKSDPGNTGPIPADLITASASGLDPHISPDAAVWQAARVARSRGLEHARIAALIAEVAEGRQFGFLGEPRVNVLRLNLRLDEMK